MPTHMPPQAHGCSTLAWVWSSWWRSHHLRAYLHVQYKIGCILLPLVCVAVGYSPGVDEDWHRLWLEWVQESLIDVGRVGGNKAHIMHCLALALFRTPTWGVSESTLYVDLYVYLFYSGLYIVVDWYLSYSEFAYKSLGPIEEEANKNQCTSSKENGKYTQNTW